MMAEAETRRPRSALFLEFLFFGRAKTCRGPQRLAVVVQGQIADVQRHDARRRFLVEDDRDRAPADTFTEGDPAAAGEPRVGEPFHALIIARASAAVIKPRTRYSARSALIWLSNASFDASPTCLKQALPSREMMMVVGNPNIGPYASCTSS